MTTKWMLGINPSTPDKQSFILITKPTLHPQDYFYSDVEHIWILRNIPKDLLYLSFSFKLVIAFVQSKHLLTNLQLYLICLFFVKCMFSFRKDEFYMQQYYF